MGFNRGKLVAVLVGLRVCLMFHNVSLPIMERHKVGHKLLDEGTRHQTCFTESLGMLIVTMLGKMVWAAAWLHRASGSKAYLDYLAQNSPNGQRSSFSWDDKYVDAQILVVKKIHHRRTSIVSVKKDPSPMTCKGGYEQWFNQNEANPNVLEEVLLGPDSSDHYDDSRSDYQLAEPTTITNAPMVGVFAFLA
ncbi:endoglucanase 13-like [Prosopis cineraria]|uniref:endoglucanase 13-like n=1 Tax=Prosopis cineraria TaxID=364024 RepID=UPI00240FB09E|nr:endoglucanase 13-like [Prosopis cineraria]